MPYEVPYVAILDVGHGNSAIIKGEKLTVVIDCGSKSSGLYDFLKQEDIHKIDKVYISHSDHDHIGGLTGIISTGEFEIAEILLNSDATQGSNAWNDLAYTAEELHEAGKTIISAGLLREAELIDCGSFFLEITGPTTYLTLKGAGGKDSQGRTITSNSLSASFRIINGNNSFAYLAGDLDQIGFDDLIRAKADLNAAVLVFPHHGGKAGAVDPIPFTKALCESVSPNTVLFSMGRDKFENPRPEIVEIVKNNLKNVRIACTQLSRYCAKKINVTDYLHLSDAFSKGREKKLCCSGTFIINIGDPIAYSPQVDLHRSFIDKYTETPLCITKD